MLFFPNLKKFQQLTLNRKIQRSKNRNKLHKCRLKVKLLTTASGPRSNQIPFDNHVKTVNLIENAFKLLILNNIIMLLLLKTGKREIYLINHNYFC